MFGLYSCISSYVEVLIPAVGWVLNWHGNVKVGQGQNISNIKIFFKMYWYKPMQIFSLLFLSQNISGDLVPLEERDPEHKESYINYYI